MDKFDEEDDNENGLNDSNEEDSVDETICFQCHGEGIAMVQNGDDENDRDWDNCTLCGGSGKLPNDDENNYTDNL